MVKMSRAHNMGAGSKLKSQTHPCKTKKSLKSVATENIHSPAPGAPLARITFRHPFSKKHINKLAKASSRNRGTVISRHLHYDTSRIELPSCFEELVPSDCVAMIDQLAKEPVLKAKDKYHRYRMNPLICNCWAFSHVNTVRRDAPPGRKPAFIAARRTGRLRGEVERLRREAAATASKTEGS